MSETGPSEQKKLYNIYALFGVSIALCVVPMMSAAILCLVFFTVLLSWAYIARNKAEEHSLTHNHMVFIIRSLWIAALISGIMMVFAALYMFQGIDHGAFNSCADAISGKGVEALEAMGYAEFYGLVQPCVDNFIAANYNILIMSVVIAAGPPLIYMAYRFIKGANRAVKGYRLAEPKAWF